MALDTPGALSSFLTNCSHCDWEYRARVRHSKTLGRRANVQTYPGPFHLRDSLPVCHFPSTAFSPCAVGRSLAVSSMLCCVHTFFFPVKYSSLPHLHSIFPKARLRSPKFFGIFYFQGELLVVLVWILIFFKRLAHSEAILASSAILLPQTLQCWVLPTCPNHKNNLSNNLYSLLLISAWDLIRIFPRPTFLPMYDCLCLSLVGAGPSCSFFLLYQFTHGSLDFSQHALQNHSSLYPFPVTKSRLCS